MAGNTTYMLESKNKVTGATLLETPEITSNLSLFWEPTDKLSLFAKAQYLGKQSVEIGDVNYALSNGNVTTTPKEPTFAKAYMTADLGATYNVNKYLTLRAGVQNVAGVKVDTGSDYGTSNPAVYYGGFTTRF